MTHEADILIVTVTKVESSATLQAFELVSGVQAKPLSIKDRIYFDLGVVNNAKVFLTQSEMGSGGLDASLLTVRKGIEALSPTAVIMVGIAFGVNEEKQAIGDILVTEQLWLYDLQRVGTQDKQELIILRGDKPHASPSLISLFKSADLLWNKTQVQVRFGAVLTGEKLIDNIDYRNRLLSFESEPIGGEMEGAGLYVACQDKKVDWILVKGICDWADGEKAKDKDSRQKTAASNAAAFVVHSLQFVPIDWQQRKGQGTKNITNSVSNDDVSDKVLGDKNENQMVQHDNVPAFQNLIQGGTVYNGGVHIHPPAPDISSQSHQLFDQKKLEEKSKQPKRFEYDQNSLTSKTKDQISNNITDKNTNTVQDKNIKPLIPITLVECEFTTSFVTVIDCGVGINHKPNKCYMYVEELDQDTTIELIGISAGKFKQGGHEDNSPNRIAMPTHEVNIPAFYIGKYPITRKQWEIVAKWQRINLSINTDPSRFNYAENLPVERVSWEEVVEFCDRLSHRTKREYRLPSESEWEYACRGGIGYKDVFHFGETIDSRLSNYYGKAKYMKGVEGEYREKTTPVGMFECANEYGLYDMHGNVSEWCQDDWQSNYMNAPSDGSAKIIDNSQKKIIRGGSWCSNPSDCRSSARSYEESTKRCPDIGFRLAISIN